MKQARYDASAVAAYIVSYCNSKGYSVTNLKLQKMLYFVQAGFLRDLNQPCFYQNIEAWDVGPVVPELYNEYSFYGSDEIPVPENFYYRRLRIKKEDMKRISRMIFDCSYYSDADLAEIIRHQNPWKAAYIFGKNSVITNESIRNFYKK